MGKCDFNTEKIAQTKTNVAQIPKYCQIIV